MLARETLNLKKDCFFKMDKKTRKEFESYSRGAEKYSENSPARFKWYGYTEEEMFQHYDSLSNLIPPNVKSILEVGCGSGIMAEMISKKRPDILYRGFDIVPENIEGAKRHYPSLNFHVGNYWNELNGTIDWDFLISCGVLFSTTDQEFVSLLFDLMNATSQKGFTVMSLRGSWGISMPLLESKMTNAIENSTGVSKYYFRGKRDFLNQPLIRRNHPFFLWRENTSVKRPEIPEVLLSSPGKEGLIC